MSIIGNSPRRPKAAWSIAVVAAIAMQTQAHAQEAAAPDDAGIADVATASDAATPVVDGEGDGASAESAAARVSVDTIAVPEAASDASSSPQALDEVVVVAQKKLQRQQDVPVSMSVIGEKLIVERGITDLGLAMRYAPNVSIQDAGYYIIPRVRGFTINLNNRAFESPVGIAIDGIPYNRVEYFTAALYDVSRIEVMRGPQGTTFGKNTTAGLIHLLSNNPTDSFSGHIDLQGGSLDRRRLEAAVGGPIIEGVANFRIAAFNDDLGGFVENTTHGISPGAPGEMRGSQRRGARAKFEIPDIAGSSLLFDLEHIESLSSGSGAEMYTDSATTRTFLRRYDPHADFIRGNNIASLNDADDRDVAIDIMTAEWHSTIGTWNVVGLGGYSAMRSTSNLDIDATPAPILFGSGDDRSPNTTLELRADTEFDGLFGKDELFGASLGHSTLLAGVFLQRRGIGGNGYTLRFGTAAYLGALVATKAGQLDPLVGLLPQGLLDQVFSLVPLDAASDHFEAATQGFDQRSDNAAFFAQSEWSFLPDWSLELGMRLSRETKTASWQQRFTSPPPQILFPLLQINEFSAEERHSEGQFQPKLTLKYSPTAEMNVFAHWGRGYRGGGFNAFAYRGDPDELTYGSETATDWGIDVKGMLFEGAAQYNLSFFLLDIDNFQTLTQIADPNGISIGLSKVENAGKARAQGVEGDFTWRTTDWMTVFATAGYNDTNYVSFKNAACPADVPSNSPGGRCDASGRPFVGAPKLNSTLNTVFTWLPVMEWELMFTAAGGVEYQSKYYTGNPLDERLVQDGFYRWRASLGVGNPSRGWSFQLIGENLTDVQPFIASAFVGTGLGQDVRESPRTVVGQFHWNF